MSEQNYQQQQYQYQPQQPYYYPQHPTSYQYLPPTPVPPPSVPQAHYQQPQYYNYNYYQQQQQPHPPAVSYNYSNYHQDQPQTQETNGSKSKRSEKENKPKIDNSKLNDSDKSKSKVKSVLPEKPLSLQIKSLNTSYTSSDEKVKYSPVYSPETIKQFVSSVANDQSDSKPSTNPAPQSNSTILSQANLTPSETQPSTNPAPQTNPPTDNQPSTNLSYDPQSVCSCCGNCIPGKTFTHRKECKKPGCKCIITCNCTCDCPTPNIPSNNICRCKGVPNACEPYESPKLNEIDGKKDAPINEPKGTKPISLTEEIKKHNLTENEKKFFPEEYKKLDVFEDLFKDPNFLFEDLKVIKMNEEEESAFKTNSGRFVTDHKIREGPIYTETRTFKDDKEYEQQVSIKYFEPDIQAEADKIILNEKPHTTIAAPPLIVRIPAKPPKKADPKISNF
jgi:hypothetical protein